MKHSLVHLVRAGHPIVAIETTDEPRAVRIVEKAAAELDRPLFTWSTTSGLRDNGTYGLEGHPGRKEELSPPGKPVNAVRFVLEDDGPGLYLFKDLGPYCKDPAIARLLRDITNQSMRRLDADKTVVLIDSGDLPTAVRRLVVSHDVGYPDEEELIAIIKKTYHRVRAQLEKDVKANLKKRELEAIAQALRGLSTGEAERLIAGVIHDDHELSIADLPKVVEGKRLLLGHTGALETIAADVRPEDVGGLTQLKLWLKQRRDGFSSAAREFGLESPRGILLLGVPGCGKSLCAKVVASDWRMPLVRLDPGTLYNKFIGETEGQLRQAIAQAESMAPCILWIDEIEKAFASANAGSADGGLSQRMFGTLLSWMQDHRHPIFIVATANDISALPPELMRKGRFDEVFFVDLPSSESRAQILEIHLRSRNRSADPFDLASLADKAQNFSGAELEQAVVAALYDAFSERKELAQRHLAQAISDTRPLADLTREKVRHLREWAENRCVMAD